MWSPEAGKKSFKK